jgi:DHA1 family bicyclomycin/chloramphenicol resistance-like MFS transporter
MTGDPEPPVVPASRVPVVLLMVLGTLGQVGTSIYLPALPAVEKSLQISFAQGQSTLAIFYLAFAVSQLLFGPLSDRYGRKPALLFGIILYLAGSFGCALVNDLNSFLAARTAQGFGAGAGLVIARAIVRDTFTGNEIGRVMALLTMSFAIIPGIAPIFGGFLNDLAGWQSIFTAIGVLSLVIFLWTIFGLAETNRERAKTLSVGQVAAAYFHIFRHPAFLRPAMVSVLLLAGVAAYFGGSADLIVRHLGISSSAYGVSLFVAISGLIAGGVLLRRLSGRWRMEAITKLGLALLVGGALAVLAGPVFDMASIVQVTLACHLFAIGVGILLPSSIAASLGEFPNQAGSAAALIGFLQLLGNAAAIALLASISPALGIIAFPALMLFFALAVLLPLLWRARA